LGISVVCHDTNRLHRLSDHSSILELLMSRGPYPTLLLLAMSLPGTVRALGLGEIRVDSSLNEPLSAQIEIVGATRDELLALTASVANREVFQRYGADRPAFLSTATFKVGLDAQGHPVLNVRSGEPFTDPLVSFLVDLRWGKNEVVREYSLLLDPAGFNTPQHTAEVAMAAVAVAQPAPLQPAPLTTTASPAPTARRVARGSASDDTSAAAPTHHKISARDTLRGIARRAGARGEVAVQRMMVAIFRANPNAFDGNINRLHRGVVLTLPSAAEVAAISAIDAKREVRSQMTAWRLDGRRSTPNRGLENPDIENPARAAVTAEESPSHATQAAASVNAADTADDSLKARVQFLEQSLQEMHQQLARHNTQLKDLATAPAPAKELAATSTVSALATPSASRAPLSGSAFLGPLAAGFALLVTGVSYTRSRFKRVVVPAPPPTMSLPVDTSSVGAATASAAAVSASTVSAAADATPTATPTTSVAAPATPPTAIEVGHLRRPSLQDTTILADIDTEALERSYLDSLGIETTAIEPTKVTTGAAPLESTSDSTTSDSTVETVQLARPDLAHANEITPESSTTVTLNGLDLEATAEHVQMPSGLNDRPVVSEGRANIVDALKTAIDRDPHRRDLRMKLLETYFSAALNNQRAFIEVVRKLARDRDKLSPEDWNKVIKMGQEIAGEDLLFTAGSPDESSDALADCA
jgi:pilus assembly protein FimV